MTSFLCTILLLNKKTKNDNLKLKKILEETMKIVVNKKSLVIYLCMIYLFYNLANAKFEQGFSFFNI